MAKKPKKKSIITKKGDKGFTLLYSGEKVKKTSRRIDICGEIDELMSILGVARTYAKSDPVKSGITSLQRYLFVCAAEFATIASKQTLLRNRITDKMVKELEEKCRKLEESMKMPRGFIVPGKTRSSAHIDHARSVARRIERKAVSLFRAKKVKNKNIIVWLNRVSDYLYLLARSEENKSKRK